MAAIRRKQYVLQPSGVAGSATATQQYSIGRPGVLRFISVDYGSGVPATTDLTIQRDDVSGSTIFTRSNSATDFGRSTVGPVPLGTAGIDETGAASAATDGLAGGLPFTTGLYIAIAQADPYVDSTDEITIDLYWEPLRKKTITVTSNAGGAGASSGSTTWSYGRPGVIRFLQVDYGASAATTDLTINADSSTGSLLFTKSNNQTDFGPSAVGTPGLDEASGALAATDAASGGLVFNTGLYVAQAQTDSSISNIVYVWYDA